VAIPHIIFFQQTDQLDCFIFDINSSFRPPLAAVPSFWYVAPLVLQLLGSSSFTLIVTTSMYFVFLQCFHPAVNRRAYINQSRRHKLAYRWYLVPKLLHAPDSGTTDRPTPSRWCKSCSAQVGNRVAYILILLSDTSSTNDKIAISIKWQWKFIEMCMSFNPVQC
jgi:hypothetical protein